MSHRRLHAAHFTNRELPDPYEALLGGPDPEAAHFLLDYPGEPVALPSHVTGAALDRASRAQRMAVRIRREARPIPRLANKG